MSCHTITSGTDNAGRADCPWVPTRFSARSPRNARFWKQLEAHWKAVVRAAGDREIDGRVEHLRKRLSAPHHGVRESAIAELEVAGKLIRTGGRVSWLPESRARTADMECCVGDQTFFVEVTAMVGAFRRAHGIPAHRALFLHDPNGPVTDGDVLIHRILARVSQKARQLAAYRQPVVLAVSVPPQEETQQAPRSPLVELDLRRLAGALTAQLLRIEHLSGVLLSLWDVLPLPASSAVRLANVGLVERSRHQAESPHVGLMVGNPMARAPLTRGQASVVRQML